MRMLLHYLCAFLVCALHLVFADIIIYAYEENRTYGAIKDMPSVFGPTIPYEGLEGMLIYADPEYACTSIQPRPTIHNRARNWIAVISRNNCSFEQKVRIAQAAKYDAVIVHSADSDNLEPMSANNTTGIYIPSVYIGVLDARYLKELLNNSKFYVIITPDAPFNINTHLLLPFAIVVGICFIVMVIFMVVKCIKDRRRARRHRLPASALNKMLLHKFVKGDPYETCAICLDDYIEGEKLRVLPCAHAYHSKCIDPWLTNNRRVCPVCKRKVFAQDEEPCPSDSDTDDDTTPLINPTTQNQPGGGTFVEESDTSRLSGREFARLMCFIRDHQVFGSDHPSINGESSSVEVSTNGSGTPATEQREETNKECTTVDEVHVHTRPGTASSSDSDIVI